jgi:osmoprotectant transport system substrate-binding protein
MKKIAGLCLSLLLAASALAGCGSKPQAAAPAGSSQAAQPSSGGDKGKVVIGGKDFTEQFILSKITSIYLKEKGYNVEEANNMGSSVVRSTLENGQVGLYWEYTGTGLVVFQKKPVETDPAKAFEEVKANDEKNNLEWLDMANFNNTFTLLMKKDEADKKGIKSVSDLANYVKAHPDELKLATDAEFYARKDGIKGLQKKYGFEFPAKNVVKMDSGLTYKALKEGQVDVGMGFATDGRIAGFNLVSLADDKQFFPAYNAAPVVRKDVLDKNPGLKDQLKVISSKLDTKTMMHLNYLVDVEHKDVSEVSRNWLKDQGLVK